jgi:hypothetical protein
MGVNGTQTDASRTVALPGGGVGIKLPNGQLADPIHVSVKSLVRMGESEFGAIIGWVESERSQRASQLAASEKALAEQSARIRAEVEVQHAARQADLEEHPWRRDHL